MPAAREIRLRGRLDDVVHQVLQFAVLTLVRAQAPSMAVVEDLRLALDEVLLDRVLLAAAPVDLTIETSPTTCRLVVAVGVADLAVDTALVTALVDRADVRRTGTGTVVTLERDWPDADLLPTD